MPFGLSDKSLSIVHGILRGHPAVERAVIYGSRARGNYREGSDIDLALEGSDLKYDVVIKIAGELEDSYLPYFVDLMILTPTDSRPIAHEIARDGVEFYRR
ncbi:MAG: nucleotidyltransferase domain-containing protein [Candidatus Pacebacteria bacterium]|nr:nucleotidyltransferase domain-containing protein [Candidatus Paceibacterota bacterium]